MEEYKISWEDQLDGDSAYETSSFVDDVSSIETVIADSQDELAGEFFCSSMETEEHHQHVNTADLREHIREFNAVREVDSDHVGTSQNHSHMAPKESIGTPSNNSTSIHSMARCLGYNSICSNFR